MELTALLNSIRTISVIGEVQRQDVSGIFYNSRKLVKNGIFVAIKGYNTDGHKYILEALSKGALAVILEDNNSIPDEIFIHQKAAKILVNDSRKALAEVSNSFFKDPTNKLKLIGITGTNGKTTTSYFIRKIFEESGEKIGVVGTIANYIGDKKIDSTLTTPEITELVEMLLDMYNEGCKYAVMEVSSHALVQKRVYGFNFAAGVFTNITSDHLDFHNSFENYLNAKKMLFDSLNENSFGIYNSDDEHSKKIISDSKAKLFSYGKSINSTFKLNDIFYDLNGTKFKIEYEGKEYNCTTSLIGEFNAYNAAAAFAGAVLLGLNPEIAIKGIAETEQVPGRFEVITKGNKKVIIDYSHTADSLEKALKAVKQLVTDDIPIYTVFGCGGNRDKSKRPIMGEIAGKYSSKQIITSDNPRFEDPFEIIKEIKQGIKTDNYKVIENREEAIKYAIETSGENAVILIAGKGHETYQEIKGIRNHFSDKEIAEKYLNR